MEPRIQYAQILRRILGAGGRYSTFLDNGEASLKVSMIPSGCTM